MLPGSGGLWVGGAFAITATAVISHHIQVTPGGDLVMIDHPTGAAALWGIAQDLFFTVLTLSGLARVIQMAVSYLRSVGERRQQLKWLASGAAVGMAGGVLTITTSGTTGFLSLAGELGVAALAALPVSMGVAILRYRMYEIDRMISRTLSYAIVTGLLVGVYVGLVLLATGVLRLHSTVAAFAGRLKDAVDLDAVRDDLIGVVYQALEPAHVSLWLSGRG